MMTATDDQRAWSITHGNTGKANVSLRKLYCFLLGFKDQLSGCFILASEYFISQLGMTHTHVYCACVCKVQWCSCLSECVEAFERGFQEG